MKAYEYDFPITHLFVYERIRRRVCFTIMFLLSEDAQLLQVHSFVLLSLNMSFEFLT
jgi:hypothetical protein